MRCEMGSTLFFNVYKIRYFYYLDYTESTIVFIKAKDFTFLSFFLLKIDFKLKSSPLLLLPPPLLLLLSLTRNFRMLASAYRRIRNSRNGRAGWEHLHRSGLGVGVGGVVIAVVSVASARQRPHRGRVLVVRGTTTGADSVTARRLNATRPGRIDGGVGGDGPLLVHGSVVVVMRKLRSEAL